LIVLQQTNKNLLNHNLFGSDMIRIIVLRFSCL
jgi:hypothetical protein